MTVYFIVGVVVVLLNAIAIVLGALALVNLSEKLAQVNAQLAELRAVPRNVIHLDLKSGGVTTDLTPQSLNIRPEDFVLRTERVLAHLREGLVRARSFERVNHRTLPTQAFCIMDQAGLHEILDVRSSLSTKKALVHLLVNGDEDALQRFLETLAESVGPAKA